MEKLSRNNGRFVDTGLGQVATRLRPPSSFHSPATMVNFDLITGCNMQKARRVKTGRLAKLHLRTAGIHFNNYIFSFLLFAISILGNVCTGVPDGDYADIHNPYGYITCQGGHTIRKNCPPGKMWDTETKSCVMQLK